MPNLNDDAIEAKQKILGQRINLVDNVKGLLVVIYMLFQIAVQVSNAASAGGVSFKDKLTFFYGQWFWHGGGGKGSPFWEYFGFSFLDLMPIAFFFVIGIVAFYIFDRQVKKDGLGKTFRRSVTRNATIVGIVLSLVIAAALVVSRLDGSGKISFYWAPHASIGFTGLILSLFMLIPPLRRSWWLKLIAAAVIFAVYYIFFDYILLAGGTEGGPAACVGYAGVMFAVGALGDLQRKKRGFLWYSIATVALFFVSQQ
jgi:uncharacterized membrane protein YhaH (DUF805 family)